MMPSFFSWSLLAFSLFFVSCSQGSQKSAESDVQEEVKETSNENEVVGPFVSEAGRFSVEFPEGLGEPGIQSIPVKTEIGEVTMHTFMVDAGSRAFFMAYSDYPEDLIAAQDAKTVLDNGRDGALANINGTLKEERNYTFESYPAKEFYAAGKQQGNDIYVRSNIIFVKERLYQVVYLSFSEEALTGEEANTYVSSFKLMSLPDGEVKKESSKEE